MCQTESSPPVSYRVPRVDDRQVVSGIVFVIDTASRSCLAAGRIGDASTPAITDAPKSLCPKTHSPPSCSSRFLKMSPADLQFGPGYMAEMRGGWPDIPRL